MWRGLCIPSKPMSSGSGSGSERGEEERTALEQEMDRIRREWEHFRATQEQLQQERDRAAGARDPVAGGRQVAGQGAGQEERQGEVDRREPALGGNGDLPPEDQDMDVDGADQAVGPAAQLAWDTQERLGHLEASVGRIGAAMDELVNVLQERETRPRGPAAVAPPLGVPMGRPRHAASLDSLPRSGSEVTFPREAARRAAAAAAAAQVEPRRKRSKEGHRRRSRER